MQGKVCASCAHVRAVWRVLACVHSGVSACTCDVRATCRWCWLALTGAALMTACKRNAKLAVAAEREERVAEDDEIVAAVNDYTRALQDGLRILANS